MERIIATVKRADVPDTADIDLPADVESAQLADIIVSALGWNRASSSATGYRLEANPPGRTLRPDETLAEAGAWDGSVITVRLSDVTDAAAMATQPEPPVSGPVTGWTPLGIDLPDGESRSRPKPPPTSAPWKQLD